MTFFFLKLNEVNEGNSKLHVCIDLYRYAYVYVDIPSEELALRVLVYTMYHDDWNIQIHICGLMHLHVQNVFCILTGVRFSDKVQTRFCL